MKDSYTYRGCEGSWFPILVKYDHLDKPTIIHDPRNILSGKPFRVVGNRINSPYQEIRPEYSDFLTNFDY